jgi:hypothetical protein
MFDKLFTLCKSVLHFNSAVQDIAIVINRFSNDYIKDGDAKDAALDCLVEIIKAHKSLPAQPVVPQPPNTIGK